ncbi:MAG: tRNA lysidine(34) synthetase TilS [Alphaproteobacteria bacterium]|nr:tRNA lysidine(34) synthetase TilS [Alphaproteobacteria bacterium]
MTAAHPLTPDEFSAALAATVSGENIIAAAVSGKTIAAAVSGGGDSMALALLLHGWAQNNDVKMVAFTVDHKLRPEAAEEARTVHGLLSARGIEHEILTWEGKKPATHIQERARDARYALLAEACRQRGIATLAVAHNREDQIETFWMRLAHGSGLDGLAGMEAARKTDGLRIIRPLLGFSRARLRATCAGFGVAWIEDPSNKSEKYLRVRLRAFEELLSNEGMTPERLARTLHKLSDAKDALQFYAARAFEACVAQDTEGAALDIEKWKEYPRDIQRRILNMVFAAVAPQVYPAGFDKTERARLDLLDPDFKGRTLAGCALGCVKGGKVRIAPENPADTSAARRSA